jgi:hypothetical protein
MEKKSINTLEFLFTFCHKDGEDLHNQDNHNGVITHLEPDIQESEVKWALEKHHYEQS